MSYYKYKGTDISSLITGGGSSGVDGYQGFPSYTVSTLTQTFDVVGQTGFSYQGQDVLKNKKAVAYYSDHTTVGDTVVTPPAWANHFNAVVIGAGGGGGGTGQFNSPQNYENPGGPGNGGGGGGYVANTSTIGINSNQIIVTVGSGGGVGAVGQWGGTGNSSKITMGGTAILTANGGVGGNFGNNGQGNDSGDGNSNQDANSSNGGNGTGNVSYIAVTGNRGDNGQTQADAGYGGYSAMNDTRYPQSSIATSLIYYGYGGRGQAQSDQGGTQLYIGQNGSQGIVRIYWLSSSNM